jgi:hypothetical protein
MARNGGRRISDKDRATAEDLCRALGQVRLTDEERKAVDYLARERMHAGEDWWSV